MKTLRDKYIIGLSALFAVGAFFVLRYGLPFHLVGDEESIIGGTLTLLQQRVLFPVFVPEQFSFLYYPVLQLYAIIALLVPFASGIWIFITEVNSLSDLQNYLLVNLDYVWVIARIVSVLAGSVLIYMTYKLAGVTFRQSKNIPLIAAFLIATSFFHFQLSVVMRHWIFTTLCLVSALYFLFKDEFTKPKSALYAGFATGLSFGLGPIGFVTGLFVTLSFIILKGKRVVQELFKKPFLIFASVASLFAVFFIATHPGAFDFIIAGKETNSLHEKSLSYYFYEYATSIGYLLGKEITIFVLGVCGIIVLVARKKLKVFFIITSIIVLHSFFLFTFFHNAPRYHFYYIPLLAITAAYFMAEAYRWLLNRKLKLTGILLFVIALLFPIFLLSKYFVLLKTQTTEQMTKEWIDQSAREDTLLINSRSIEFLQSDESVNIQQKYGRVRAQSNALKGIDTKKFGREKYQYINIHFWDNMNKNTTMVTEVFKNYKPQYYIVTYDHPDELLSELNQFIISKGQLVHSLTNTAGEPVGQAFEAFSDFGFANELLFNLDRLGQHIDIYRLAI